MTSPNREQDISHAEDRPAILEDDSRQSTQKLDLCRQMVHCVSLLIYLILDCLMDPEVLYSTGRVIEAELKKCICQIQSSADIIQGKKTDHREISKQALAQAEVTRPVQNMDQEKKTQKECTQGFDQKKIFLDASKRDVEEFFESAIYIFNNTREKILGKVLMQKEKYLAMLQDWTIKVCSLNVCGLANRLRENKPKFEEFINEHEILCFTEINAYEADATAVGEHSIHVNGYQLYMKFGQERQKRLGGIGIYVHEKLQPFIKVIEGDCEYVLWIKIKDIIPTSVLLGVVYIPSKAILGDFERFANEVKRECSRNGNVILTGDFNSHTQTDKDFFENDDFKDMLTIFERLSIPLERSNQDKTCKRWRGNKLIELCKQNNIRILNGRLFSDKGIGEPTFIRSFTNKENQEKISQTVIDYVIATDRCLELFKSFKVRNVIAEGNTFSDHHSALVFELDCNPLAFT